LREEYLFGQTTDEAAIQAAGVKPPAVVLYKTFDEGRVDLASAEVASATTESLTAFIKGNSVPLLDQISGENYAIYATSGLPLAYLFLDPEDPKKDEYINELMPIAKEHKGAVNFVWIDAVKFVEHAKSLVLTEPKWPSFVIQDPKSQLKYPLDQSIAPTHQVVNQMMSEFVAGRLEPKLKTEPVPESQDQFAYYKVVGTTFEEVVLDNEKDVFVQFSAPWWETSHVMIWCWL
jgi:protein disulfide-isomerase A1